MIGIVFRLLERVLMGACMGSLSLVFAGLGVLLRYVPRLFALVRLVLRGFLVLSFRLYRMLFDRAAPAVEQVLGIDILSGLWRVAAAVLVSLALGLSLLLLLRLRVTGWSLMPCFLHGLFVGLAWDEIREPGSLNLGVKIR